MSSNAARGRKLIVHLLADDAWHPTADVVAALAAEGVGDRDARRLADDLGVERQRLGFPSRGMWRLPPAPVPVEPRTLAELRERLDDRAQANAVGTRDGLARVVRAVLEAQQVGDLDALRAACVEAATELILWHDLADRLVAREARASVRLVRRRTPADTRTMSSMDRSASAASRPSRDAA